MRALIVVMMMFAVTGCSVTVRSPDRVIMDSDGTVTIENNRHYKSKGKNKYKHCPPGQAKKGNC